VALVSDRSEIKATLGRRREPRTEGPASIPAIGGTDPGSWLNSSRARIIVVKRVVIVGAGGSGKSTFARRLGGVTGLPLVHLDQLAFRPGWVSVPKDEWRAIQEDLVAGDEWIVDGNRESTMPIRLRRCDTVIFLDYPRVLSTFRALKRQVLYRGRDIQAEGCPEQINLEFIQWVWQYNSANRPKTLRMIEEHAPRAVVVRLTGPRRAKSYLLSLEA
jgi:adenylate kinase family enzyme